MAEPAKAVTALGARSSNDLQRRVRRWLSLHPDADTSTVVIRANDMLEFPDGYIVIGVIREVEKSGRMTEKVLSYDAEESAWTVAVNEPYLNDVAEFDYEDQYIHIPQSSTLACTGLSDKELASVLHVRQTTLKSWMRADKPVQMPVKAIQFIADHYSTNNQPKPIK